MAKQNVPQQRPMAGKQSDDSASSPAQQFAAGDAALLLRNVTAARSILRAVALAARAQHDGSVEYKDNNTMRWGPAVDEACTRLQVVRDLLMETSAAPNLDWVTSLSLSETIAAALWQGHCCSKGEGLEAVELESVAEVAIESLDSLLDECVTQGVFEMARAPEAAAVH